MNDDRTPTHRTDDPDWTGADWASRPDAPADAADSPDRRWNKTSWVGDDGDGRPLPVDPADMPEGETAIGGRRHAPGEQHWAPDPGVEPPTSRPRDTRTG